MGVPGCELDTAALQQVRPLFCLLYNLSQLPWSLNQRHAKSNATTWQQVNTET